MVKSKVCWLVLSLIFLQVNTEGKWVAKKSMPTKRSDFSAVTLGDQIIVTGGCDMDQECPSELPVCVCPSVSSSTFGYKPSSDEWVTLAEMPTQRFRHGAAVVGTKMYLVGGRDVNDTIITTVDEYDSATNTWRTLSSKSKWQVATSDLVVVAVGKAIFAISGYDQNYASTANISVFDTNTLVWQDRILPLMQTARGDACAVSIDGSIYVLGGFSDVNFCVALASLEVFDTVSNTWSSRAPLEYPRGDAACQAQHGELHAIGGEQKNNVSSCNKYDYPINHVEHYHPPTNTWAEETQLPQERFRFASASYGNTFYVFGGQTALDTNTLTNPLLDTVIAWDDNFTDAATQPTISFALLFLAMLFHAQLVQ